MASELSKPRAWALGELALALSAPLAAQQGPLRIFIRASEKTHVGQHAEIGGVGLRPAWSTSGRPDATKHRER